MVGQESISANAMEPLYGLHLSVDGEGPLYGRLYRKVREAILDGRAPSGSRLPSTRALAKELRVSRNVVMLAYDQLLAEGYVSGRVGAGTFVSSTLPDVALPGRGSTIGPMEPPAAPRLSRRAQQIVARHPLPAAGSATGTSRPFDFRYGVPSLSDFPHETWRRLHARHARGLSVQSLGYGSAQGLPRLREELAAYLRRSRGVSATADQVIIVNGSQQALSLTASLLLNPGDHVLVEEPSYLAARQIFAASSARVLSRPVDENGLEVERLPRGKSVRLAYVTPSHQFPTGAVLSLSRRIELIHWAESVGAYILEDDYNSEFRYDGKPLAAVQGLDRAGRVLYTGTFSKVLWPSLRIGYLVVPAPMVPSLAAMRWLTDCHTPTFEQEVLADFITEGHFEAHLRRARARNAARRTALLDALGRLGARTRVTGGNAGLHLLVWLPGVPASSSDVLIAKAGERGVGIYSVAPHFMNPPREAGLLLGYASLEEERIREGIGRLAQVLDELQLAREHRSALRI